MKEQFKPLLLILMILVLSISQGNAQGVTAQASKMTLQECIDYALENHTDIINAEIDQKISKAQVGETRGMGLPQIDANLATNFNYAIQTAVFGGQDFELGSKYDGNLQVKASQLLFDGSYIIGLKAAKTYTNLADKQLIKTKIDRVQAVKEAYFQILISEKRLNAFSSNLQRLDTTLMDTKALYENGFAEKIDVDRIRVNINNVKTELSKVERLIDFSRTYLKFQIGMPLEEDLKLADELTDPGVLALIQESSQTIDPEMRIEYQELGVNIDLAHLDMRRYQMEYLPQVSLIANYGWNGFGSDWNELNKFKDNWFEAGAVGVKVSIPIFKGAQRPYRVKQARLKKLQLENQREYLKSSIQVEVKQFRDQLIAAEDQLVFQKENVELAESVRNTTKEKYVEGIGSNLELVTSENDLIQAQINYYNAMYESIVAYVALQKAMGILY